MLDVVGEDTYYYDDTSETKSVFRFIDKTASNDSSLLDLILSRDIVDDSQDPPVVNTQNYDIYPVAYEDYQGTETPGFVPEELKNTSIINEYIEKIDLTATLNHGKSSMKIKIPARDPVTNELILDGSRRYNI